MNCEKCGVKVIRTISDDCVSKFRLYKTIAYYCDFCDEIFIIDKFKDKLEPEKYAGELTWLRRKNPNLKEC